MSTYNLITLQDLQTTSDVENKTIVCGTLLTTGSTFANKLDQNTFNALSTTLEINGSTTAGNNIQVNAGSVTLGPYPSKRYVNTSAIQYTVDSHISFNLNQGNEGATITLDQNLPTKCAAITSGILLLSETLSQLPPNNNVTFPSSQPGPLNFNVINVDANGIAVYNLSANLVFGNDKVQQIGLTSQNTGLQLVVINLYGASVTWSGSNLVGDWFNTVATGESHTIWNFYEATTIVFDSNLRGALLAPLAVVTTNINIDGSVAVRSLYSTGEVHSAQLVFPNCVPTVTQTITSQLNRSL
jgi:choice-of-anchor A domain-containing protein